MLHCTAFPIAIKARSVFYFVFKQKNYKTQSRKDKELREMQTLVDNLKEEIMSLSTKRKEDLQQQHRKHIEGQLVEDLQHRLMESENLIQVKSEQVYQISGVFFKVFGY